MVVWFKYHIPLLLILFLALVLRTWNYTNRISIVSDNTRDLSVAYYAATHFKLPWIGQFSSAGPFFYGPLWYWFMGLVSYLPFGIMTHWYVMTVISLIFVAACYYGGKLIGGKFVGFLAALFAAISPESIGNSFSTWNPAIIPLLSLIIHILLIKALLKNNWRWFAVLGLAIGVAITVHFQSLLLAPIPVLAGLYLLVRKNWKTLVVFVVLFIIPFIPLILFDLRFNWFEARHLWWYFTVGQYNIWVPNRWLLYIGKYWPYTWSQIVGGVWWLGAAFIALISMLTVLYAPKWRHHRAFFILAIAFVCEITLFRYFRGERFVYYSFFAHGTVILLSAWVVYRLLQWKKFLGGVFLAVIVYASLQTTLAKMTPAEIPLASITQAQKEIYAAYPNQTFAVYGCYSTMGELVAYPIGYFMYRDGRGSPDGVHIGVCYEGNGHVFWRLLTDEESRKDNGSWFNRTTQVVHHETVEWWMDKPPL